VAEVSPALLEAGLTDVI